MNQAVCGGEAGPHMNQTNYGSEAETPMHQAVCGGEAKPHMDRTVCII